jgi:hypothetical protein
VKITELSGAIVATVEFNERVSSPKPQSGLPSDRPRRTAFPRLSRKTRNGCGIKKLPFISPGNRLYMLPTSLKAPMMRLCGSCLDGSVYFFCIHRILNLFPSSMGSCSTFVGPAKSSKTQDDFVMSNTPHLWVTFFRYIYPFIHRVLLYRHRPRALSRCMVASWNRV